VGPRRRRPIGWTVVGGLVALGVVGPLLALPLSFTEPFDETAWRFLPGALRSSALLGLGVGTGTLVVGGGLALLISFWDFPGRKVLDWALVLPMAMPGYVLTFVLLAQYGRGNALQSNLLGDGLDIPLLRTTWGAIAILTSVLYPYVYVLGRSAFVGQSRQPLEAARSMGRTYRQAVWQVALPMARPALAAGAALAVMEALADFGTVDLLGIQALPNAIYRVWNGGFDEGAALQLATVLVGLALTMVTVERALRGRARYHQALGRGDAVQPRRLGGAAGLLAAAPGTFLLVAVFLLPVAQLAAWSIEVLGSGDVAGDMWSATRHTVFLGAVTVVVAVTVATVVAYGQRSGGSRLNRILTRCSTLGYAVPGTVVAVAVYGPLVWLDRRLIDVAESAGRDIGLLITGSILGLVLAYTVRFHALAFFSVEARMGRISTDLDDAARALGADRARVLADVHVPLLRPGLVTASLLVLVEVMKELPATALLRPLGRDTLAITVYEATKDSRLDAAALPALLIVVVGLLPVIVLVRTMRDDGWTSAGDAH
jgi:iron(III) transport system permease protein